MSGTPSRQQGALLAGVFSPVVIRALSRADITGGAGKLAVLAELMAEQPDATLGDAFNAAHRLLERGYRSEYLFKNEIVSRIVFGRHSPRTATPLFEVPMGASCADVLIINGTSTVYEIKTDLDQFTRLDAQLRDYSSRAERVYVVTSEARVNAVLNRIPAHVGVLGLRRNGSLTTTREAESNLTRLNSLHLFELLRTSEVATVLGRLRGYVPNAHQAEAWLEMRELFAALDPVAAHSNVVGVLRARNASSRRLVEAVDFPASLRALAYMGDYSNIGRARITRRLSSNAALYGG